MKLSILLVLVINICHAGNEVGNGGDVVVCAKNAPLLLDFHENTNSKLPYEFVQNSNTDEYKYLREVWKALSSVSPKFYKKYMNDLGAFKNKVKFLPNANFRDVRDSFHISIPKGCKLHQIAIQRQDSATKNMVIYINEDLYNKMSVDQKAGLISHEIVYEHFRFFGQNHSVNVRKFNRYLFSKKMTKSTQKAFVTLIQNMGIPSY